MSETGDHERSKRRMLRILCGLTGACGLGIFAIGWLPGSEIYTDANGCFGRALGALAAHGGRHGCEPRYTLDHTELVLDEPLQWLALALVLAPGVLVWLRPRLRFALLWSALAVPCSYLGFVAWFDLKLFARTEALWPSQVFAPLAIGLLVMVLLVIPISCLVFAIHARARKSGVKLPRARVVQ